MRDLHQAALAQVDALGPYLLATAQELVRIPSVNHPPTGDEYTCQMVVAAPPARDGTRARGVLPPHRVGAA